MGQAVSPPFNPTFGSGAPGANVDVSNWYFDTSTTPYTLYTHNGAAGWKAAGAIPAINATQIQGVAVSAGAPSSGNVLTDIAGTWTPH